MICNRKSKATLAVVVLTLLFLIIACGGQQTKSDNQAAAQQPDPPLAKSYRNIIVGEISSTPEIKKDYPEALNECKASLMSALLMQNKFKSVTPVRKGTKYPSASLLVKTSVSDIHIVHGAARFWAGAFAGSSYMNLKLKLTDGATGKVVREKEITSANNAWAAAWVGGSSDHTLPADMGKIVAGYIGSIMPN